LVEAGLRVTRAEVIAVSRFEQDLAVRRCVAPLRRLHLIPNGISDSAPTADPSRPGPAKVVMIARFAPPKDFDTLVRACALIGAPFELVLIGEGPLRKSTEELVARLRLQEKVRFAGECSDIGVELASAQIVALSSRSEAQGLCLLEGMRAALPVVATNAEGMRDLVVAGVNGFLVEPGNVAQMAAALQSLIEDPTLRVKLGRAGRTAFERLFRAADMVARIEGLYHSMACSGDTIARSGPRQIATHLGNSV
jgi:glycosyltransferase involved in cell wall biosynthesis